MSNYAKYVPHPRYGRRPKITGLNPENQPDGSVFIHWWGLSDARIANTAIAADTSKQRPATVPVTHYFDVHRDCRDCNRPFIFFADEQRFWYEELGFPLEVDCVRCVPCRLAHRGLERQRARYEELFHVPEKTNAQKLEMAECAIALVESGAFHKRQVERVRMLLNQLPPDLEPEEQSRVEQIRSRLAGLAASNKDD